MLNTNFKHSITYFLLAAFLLVRVVNLHKVSHVLTHATYEHCEVCDLITVTNQATPLQENAPRPGLALAMLFATGKRTSNISYSAPYQKILLSDYFHNKPPPSPFLG
jgi:hypothetical protein